MRAWIKLVNFHGQRLSLSSRVLLARRRRPVALSIAAPTRLHDQGKLHPFSQSSCISTPLPPSITASAAWTLVASHGPDVGMLQASPRQHHGSNRPPRDHNFRLAERKKKGALLVGAAAPAVHDPAEDRGAHGHGGHWRLKNTLNHRLRTLPYWRAELFCASVTVRPLVDTVVKADARVFVTSKKARSHFSGAIC